ncbi:MAG: dihydroorotase [Actinomycetota bacterium]
MLESGDRAIVDAQIDARGCLIFPGFIDPHVHSRDPGLTEKEDIEHATAGAAAGGITTIFDMPNTIPPPRNASILGGRVDEHLGRAFTDFGLWGLAIPGENTSDIAQLFRAGAIGVKLFWPFAITKSDNRIVPLPDKWNVEDFILPADNGTVFELFQTVAEIGGLLAAHCEDPAILNASRADSLARPASFDTFLRSRPAVAESVAVATGIELARATGCRFHAVHLSTGRASELIKQGQNSGAQVSGETCPQYLLLSDADYGSIGAAMKVVPPIRGSEEREGLWAGVRSGTITSLGSDHAPHTVMEKAQEEFEQQPPGGIGVETLGPLMINEALQGRLPLESLAWLLSEGTARLYRLFPRKGSLLPGGDADFTIVDPSESFEIRNERLHAKNKLSAWHGRRLLGRIRWTVLRGETIAVDGEPVGSPRGQFISPEGRA